MPFGPLGSEALGIWDESSRADLDKPDVRIPGAKELERHLWTVSSAPGQFGRSFEMSLSTVPPVLNTLRVTSHQRFARRPERGRAKSYNAKSLEKHERHELQTTGRCPARKVEQAAGSHVV